MNSITTLTDGSFRISLFIDLGRGKDLGTWWREDTLFFCLCLLNLSTDFNAIWLICKLHSKEMTF